MPSEAKDVWHYRQLGNPVRILRQSCQAGGALRAKERTAWQSRAIFSWDSVALQVLSIGILLNWPNRSSANLHMHIVRIGRHSPRASLDDYSGFNLCALRTAV